MFRNDFNDLFVGQRILVTGHETAANPMRRLGRMEELTNLCAFLMAPDCELLSGQTVAIDGADHLANGAYFTHMDWSDAQWQAARERIMAINAQDRALRTAGSM